MEPSLQDTIILLSRTPAVLDALLRDLPESWTLANEGESTFSALDVIGHLIYGEKANWMPRARTLLEFGETKTFDPLDRRGHAKEQPKKIGELLDEFARWRGENMRQLQALNLGPPDLERRGRHPAFGTITLSALLATWAAHDLTHLHQLSRVMAHQYRNAVGPYIKYLGVLHCDGHSAPA